MYIIYMHLSAVYIYMNYVAYVYITYIYTRVQDYIEPNKYR